MVLADMHAHSDNSSDGKSSVVEMCVSAIDKGLGYLALTDHCEMTTFYEDKFDLAIKQSYFDYRKVSEIFRGQIKLCFGVEMGFSPDCIREADKLVIDYPFDIVLGSVHNLPGMQDFYFLNFDQYDVKKLMNRYFDAVYELAQWGRFNVLCHLTYPLRYITGKYEYEVDLKEYEEKIDRVFKEIIKKDIALEINTSGLRQAYGEFMPDRWCLEKYASLGGKLLTVGSDAHRAKDIGANIGDGAALAKSLGFTEICIFEKKKPQFFGIA